MSFQNLKEVIDTNLSSSRMFTFRKAPTQTTTAGVWFDLSMSPGNPVPNYYAASPLLSVQMKQSTDGGIYHGVNNSTDSKYIRQSLVLSTSATGLPLPMILCDYLMYYPFIDEGTLDEQPLTNSVSLPRYTDGNGVQIMAISVAARTGGQTFRVTYTNSQGVSGRVSKTVIQNTATAIGSIVTSQNNNVSASGAFIPLQDGDTGVRSIESVQMISGTDVGLFTLVLVKPILTTCINEQTAPVETDYLINQQQLPEIKPDAYLNFICLPRGSLSATQLNGILTTITKE